MKSFKLFRLVASGVAAMACLSSAALAQGRPDMGSPPPGQSQSNWNYGPGTGQGMGPGTGQGMGPGTGQGMGPGMGQGMGPGMGQGMSRGPGMGYGPGHGYCREHSGAASMNDSGNDSASNTSPRFGMMQMQGHIARHMLVMRDGVPTKYRGKENPVAATRATLTEGEQVYADNCASCHSESGLGDGPAGKDLNPRPANLYRTLHSRIASDEFLFWTISEGGEPLKSGMKAFKEKLSDDQIWKVITFLRAGMPRMAQSGQK